MTEPTTKKRASEVLKEALAAKKSGSGVGTQKLRPEMGKAKGNKDAARRAGKSRKVH